MKKKSTVSVEEIADGRSLLVGAIGGIIILFGDKLMQFFPQKAQPFIALLIGIGFVAFYQLQFHRKEAPTTEEEIIRALKSVQSDIAGLKADIAALTVYVSKIQAAEQPTSQEPIESPEKNSQVEVILDPDSTH